MRRAVSLAAPLAYQHSRMIFPITLKAFANKQWYYKKSELKRLNFKWLCVKQGLYLVALPPVGYVGPQSLVTHDLPHFLYGRVRGHEVIVWQLVLLMDACWNEATVKTSHHRLFLRNMIYSHLMTKPCLEFAKLTNPDIGNVRITFFKNRFLI